MLVVGILLGFRPDGGPVGVAAAIALLLVFAFSLSWVWTTMGLRMKTPETVMQASMTVLFPLTFASNVFVDPDTMPGWVQAFVNHNPISHAATASRELMHGAVDSTAILWVLGWSLGAGAGLRPDDHAGVPRRALITDRLGSAGPSPALPGSSRARP